MLFLKWKKTDALNGPIQSHLFLLFCIPRPLKFMEFEGVSLMGKDMNQYVLSILENYPEMSRRIELMRYELHSSMVVLPHEMIEVMSFSKKDTEANTKYPHTVPEIALCYKDIAKRLNREITEDAMDKYIALIRERDRLQHRIGLLEQRQAEIIREYYFCRNSWNEISKNMGISVRTAYSVRQQAVDALAQMYTFTGAIFDGTKE